MSERDRPDKDNEIESLNEGALDADNMSIEDLEQVSGGGESLDCSGYGGNCTDYGSCGTYTGDCTRYGPKDIESQS